MYNLTFNSQSLEIAKILIGNPKGNVKLEANVLGFLESEGVSLDRIEDVPQAAEHLQLDTTSKMINFLHRFTEFINHEIAYSNPEVFALYQDPEYLEQAKAVLVQFAPALEPYSFLDIASATGMVLLLTLYSEQWEYVERRVKEAEEWESNLERRLKSYDHFKPEIVVNAPTYTVCRFENSPIEENFLLIEKRLNFDDYFLTEETAVERGKEFAQIKIATPNEVYYSQVVRESDEIGDLVEEFLDSMWDYSADFHQDRIVIKRHIDEAVAYDRCLIVESVWLDAHPVCIVTRAGRGGRDDGATFITDALRYKEMIALLQHWQLERREVEADHPDEPQLFLTKFYNQILEYKPAQP